ncbi:MAG: hypothetical protein P4N59_14890 [Negativicutes bacterium]|nr:hypothetical protein [Negativicutes bacterium]
MLLADIQYQEALMKLITASSEELEQCQEKFDMFVAANPEYTVPNAILKLFCPPGSRHKETDRSYKGV